VILKGENGTFGDVSTVILRWYKLVVDVLAAQMDDFRAVEASLSSLWRAGRSPRAFVCPSELGAFSTFHGLSEDGVTVMIVENE
jgi:hypothetical protein